MEFNASGAVFAKKNNFTDSMRQFISEEAAIFSPEKEEAASASMDRTAEKIVRFSADKSKVKAKEQKRILDSIKGDNIKSETGHVAEGKTEIKAVSSKMDKFTDERSGSDVKASQSKPKEVSSSEKSAKKDISR